VKAIDFTVGIYARRGDDGTEHWHALLPDQQYAYASGPPETRERRMIDRLRDILKLVTPASQPMFQFSAAAELLRAPVDLKLTNGRVVGKVPIVVEPIATGPDSRRYLAYHPMRRDECFFAADVTDVELLAQQFFRHTWDALEANELERLTTNSKDRLITLGFSATPRSLIDELPSKKQQRTGARMGPQRVLQTVGVDETARLARLGPVGMPRAGYRERMANLLGGDRPRAVAVVGPPGSGKTSLIHRWIQDRVAEDGFPIHNNLDRLRHVWRLAGKRLIAGMSYLGQWEERLLALLEEARTQRAILWFEDLHLFGRLGQSRQSERSFADFFRGPIRRGDVAMVAELTPEQYARLERDAPGLAEALATVSLPAASPAETQHLLLHTIRELEPVLRVALHPFVPRAATELGAALFPWRARPGVAIEIVRRVAQDARAAAGPIVAGPPLDIEPRAVLATLARTTGLSPELLSLEQPLDVDAVEAAFAARVIGQPVAVHAATDVVVKVRAGLADPGRPVSVMLFTGPTGTGKTELANAIAEYLYGGGERLVRVDMGELSGPDAVMRLIGDGAGTEGLLTARVRAQPFCVVLLDEIEKAHSQALHLLLQLFDEGRLTDASGDVASFASAVVIMTSNLGARSSQPIGFGDARERIMADVARAVRDFFPIELFNRIDQVVPFAPLTPEVAAKVVDKELAKLLARRGLRERNTFVYAGSAVRRRAVEDAFDPRYGARTVKRWLEDHVGGTLTDLLAGAPPARLRIVRLSEDGGTLVGALEPMVERQPLAGPFLLADRMDLAVAALERDRPAAIAALARAAAVLDELRGTARPAADVAFFVDELDERLRVLRQLLGAPEPTDDEHAGRTRSRGRARYTPPSRDALTAAIAEALLLAREAGTLLDPDAHAVTVAIGRIGDTKDAGGVGIALDALGDDFDSAAIANDRGVVTPILREHVLRTTARDAVLILRGLFVRAKLATDHGTWLVRSAAAEPDVVRVQITPGASAAADATLRARIAERRELEAVLDRGGALPPNPDALLPVTRTLTYRAPLRASDPFGFEHEDLAIGWVDDGTAHTLADAIRRARHVAWSLERRA
jgi:ATP-dependent Clp protease ATP-binding subunit ClpA/ATP-dependent Clp protease ATP-binding subunit ClpC